METRNNIAAEKKRCGSHNCAQAILHTYADIAGIDEELAMNIAHSFGAGMGHMEGTCGAMVGAGLVLGLVNKDKAKSRYDNYRHYKYVFAPATQAIRRGWYLSFSMDSHAG